MRRLFQVANPATLAGMKDSKLISMLIKYNDPEVTGDWHGLVNDACLIHRLVGVI